MESAVCEMGSNLSGDISEVKFLTIAEVASVMRVSKMTVYRMVHGGEIPAVRVGRSFRVPEQAVHDYLRGAFLEAGGASGLAKPACGSGPVAPSVSCAFEHRGRWSSRPAH